MRIRSSSHDIIPYILVLSLIAASFFIGTLRGTGQSSNILLLLMVLLGMALLKLVFSIHKLQREAYVDGFTRLWNRRYFEMRLTQEIERSNRTHSPLCLLMVDIDNLKQVNDSEGHEAGDRLLKAASNVLRTNTREYDVVARWGGDEFAIILTDTDIEKAQCIAERMRVEIADHYATVSVGLVAAYPGVSFDTLFRAADYSLYKAKEQKNSLVVDGRHCVAVTELRIQDDTDTIS
jgi:diguanylate cyclase (GGDEF)-like protein